ncbi:MAG: MerR family transcriptional regulator [Roseateles sp.]|uniref:MerR family transcriptional regulator n=1 Tax=Roseateles sp. TaxID=1971397 RepID=UPI004035407C
MTETTFHRSGAVARMLRMPVATLRIWERRYALTQPALSASGQRLYSADDVRRLALIKQLTDSGHAIGSLAPLDMAQLQQVASTHANALAATQKPVSAAAVAGPPREPLRLVVIGAALGARLRRPALLRRLGSAVELLGPFDDAALAAEAVGNAAADAVLAHQPQLHAGWQAAFDAAAPAFAALPKAVLYRYAADAVCEALADAGTQLLREPQPDAAVAQWLQGLATQPLQPARQTASPGVMPARRWDDAALADIAGLSSTMACECPRHVAELLMQLSHFEAYSADCEHRSPADAALHAHLRRVTATCRASFESALEHIAQHEGLLLPP